MNFRDLLIAAALCAFASNAWAQEEEEEKDPLEGSIKLGYLATTGNTETSSLNTGFDAAYSINRWTHEARGLAINATENEVTTAEAYELGWKSGWDFTEKDYLFGQLDWRKDRFGGFDTQFSQTVGYGRRILGGPVHRLDANVGAGARQSEDQLGVTQDETIVTGDLDYRWKFSETAEFKQTLRVEAGDENTFTEAVASIAATLVGNLRLVASYTYRNNSDVPLGSEKTDTRTAISLEYGF